MPPHAIEHAEEHTDEYPIAPAVGPGLTDVTTTVAVEATRLLKDDRGIGRYVRALLPRLLALRPALRLALFARPGDVARLTDEVAGCHEMRGRVVVHAVGAMRRARADVFWYPWNVARPTPSTGVVVATVHDIAPVALAESGWRHWHRNRRWRRLYAATAARGTLLVADSAFTAAELRREFGVPRSRLRVVPLAADESRAAEPDAERALLARLGVRRPFVLAVGAAERRKNLAALDRAMARVVEHVPEATLVLAGPRPRNGDAAPQPSWKRTVGYVRDADLVGLYRAATCVVVPSTYEGFGLPVLEAMRLGAPVIAARRASLPEVGGDAAAWVEPDDDAALATAIRRLLVDEGARAAMREAGLARAALFTWDGTARRTLAAFDEARALGERRDGVLARAPR